MSDTEAAGLQCLREGGVARLVLDRPEVLNALDDDLLAELHAQVERLAGDDAVRCVVLTGNGRAFCSGADVRRSVARSHDDLGRGMRAHVTPTILALRRMPKPVIAAVGGPAAGVGCSLALACDLVIASRSAYFLLAFANIGLLPDGGATLTVPARVGLARAAALALLAERLPADEALAWGLIDRVVSDDELPSLTTSLARRLAAGPTQAYAAVKQALNASTLDALERQLELEAELQTGLGRTADFAEGVAAFTERRRPEFTGARG